MFPDAVDDDAGRQRTTLRGDGPCQFELAAALPKLRWRVGTQNRRKRRGTTGPRLAGLPRTCTAMSCAPPCGIPVSSGVARRAGRGGWRPPPHTPAVSRNPASAAGVPISACKGPTEAAAPASLPGVGQSAFAALARGRGPADSSPCVGKDRPVDRADAGEDAGEGVVVLRTDRVELVIVAAAHATVSPRKVLQTVWIRSSHSSATTVLITSLSSFSSFQ